MISCFKIAESLGNTPRARLVAVMTVVSMRPKPHLTGKVQENAESCQTEIYDKRKKRAYARVRDPFFAVAE